MRRIINAGRRLAGDRRGNVAILFAFSSLPLVALLGGAVDMTRQARYKAQILNAMDSAGIALVRRGARNDAEADEFVNAYIASMLPANGRDASLHLSTFNATKIDGGYRITSDGFMETGFMTVVRVPDLPLDLQSEVVSSTGAFEVALVLDNTGSMAHHGRIEALRDAAGVLVDDLFEEGSEGRVKMALVPFVTSVNIKTPGVFDASWIDGTGGETYGFNFDKPSDRLSLFKSMRVEWRGCVEAREPPYDEDDTAPTTTDTKWVPYLWPDEPDSRGYDNSYLPDSSTASDLDRLRNTAKYTVRAGTRISNSASKGPNAACARPIVELTDDTARMHEEIRRMVPHNASGGNNSGTNVSQGLMWGWRVLSPEEPYTQGAAYEDDSITKVLVLLSDGRNQIVPNGRSTTRSDYTSYGYLAQGRLDSETDYLAAERAVDDKVRRVCESVKGKGIRVYTILFQVDFEKTQDLFRDCASEDEDGEPLYFYIPDASQLETAFEEIGKDLTSIRIVR